MEQITLPNRPTNLSPKVEVLEFAHEGIKARVILSLDDSLNNGHLLLQAQAYQMTDDGGFVPCTVAAQSWQSRHIRRALSILNEDSIIRSLWRRRAVPAARFWIPRHAIAPRRGRSTRD